MPSYSDVPSPHPPGTPHQNGLGTKAEAVFFWILIAVKVLFWVARALGPSSCQRGRTAPA